MITLPHAGWGVSINKGRHTIITLNSVGISFRQIAKESHSVSKYSFLHHRKGLENWRKL